MKQVLGKTLLGKKVVSQSGGELGRVFDLEFSLDGTMNHLIIKPNADAVSISEYINEYNLVNIPYSDVKAIGEYVVVDFPKK